MTVRVYARIGLVTFGAIDVLFALVLGDHARALADILAITLSIMVTMFLEHILIRR